MTANEEVATANRTSGVAWVRVIVLLLGTFTVVTSQTISIGLSTPIAESLRTTPGLVGLGVTITSVVTAVTAPFAPRLIGGADRRFVIAGALLLLALGNAVAAFSPEIEVFLASRIILALGIAGVWALAGAVAARLVAPRHSATAVSVVVGGISAASVLGVPLGTALGAIAGWRSTFAVLALVAAGAAVLIVLSFPALPRREPQEQTADAPPLSRPRVVWALATIAALVVAQYVAYTYVRPVLEHAGLSAGAIAAVLFAYGCGGLIGNFVAGTFASRRPRRTVIGIACVVFAVLITLAVAGADPRVSVVAVIAWGLSYGGVSVAGQIWATRLSPGREEHITALYVGIFNAAIALGSLIGGAVIGTGVDTLLIVASMVTALAVLLAFLSPDGKTAAS